MPFRLYTVAETKKPIRTSGGMQIVPDYTIQDAPAPKVIVIPAQSQPSPAVLEWIRKSSKTTDVTMSVCTGAFVLAKTGLLKGKSATTYHGAFERFAMEFPDIQLKRGARFVENGNLATAGGLSSGIDLALRVVERYYGRDVARKTAYNMEYQGEGWMNPDSNQMYATALFQLPSIRSARFVEWTLIRRSRRNLSSRARLIISARKTTRKPSTRPRRNLSSR